MLVIKTGLNLLKKTILQQYSKNEVVEAWVDKTVGQ